MELSEAGWANGSDGMGCSVGLLAGPGPPSLLSFGVNTTLHWLAD